MENEQQITPEEEVLETPRQGYVKRPLWQVLLAWVGLGLMVGLLLMQLALMLKGGL